MTADSHRHFGRLGLGAVFGSKKLKALVFSGRKSISVEDKKKYRDIYDEQMKKMLTNLSKSFFNILKSNSRVIIQFYPKNKEIIENIGKIIAKNTAFKGNFIIDNPNSQKKRKIYLVLKKGI